MCGSRPGRVRRLATGGRDTLAGEQPWFGGLVKRVDNGSDYSMPFCGASLISDRYLLTAGHCLYGKRPADLAVLLDFYDLSDFDTSVHLFNVSRVQVHERYVDHLKRPEVDIALLRLDRPVPVGDRIRPVCLPDRPRRADYAVQKYVGLLTTLGWGRLSKNGPQAEHLQQVSMPQDLHSCSLVYGERFHQEHICLKDTRNLKREWMDVCKGDSGGPLLHRWNRTDWLVGVTSYGNCLGIPAAVFTRVTSYLDWIQEHTADSLYCKRPAAGPELR